MWRTEATVDKPWNRFLLDSSGHQRQCCKQRPETPEQKGLKQAVGARFGEVSGVIHFYYHAAPAGGRSGKLFLKQSGGLSSELLPACGRGQRGAYRG